MLAAGVATLRALTGAIDLDPACVAGHSLGEYSALVSAGAISFADAMRLVRLRGEAMQRAVADGESLMAAVIGLDDAEIESVCESVGRLGTTRQLQRARTGGDRGRKSAVLAAIEAAKEAGAKRALPLAVSVPAHTSLMAPAALVLGKALENTGLQMPMVPVMHNVDAQPATDLTDLAEKLVRQVAEPVRFVDCVEAMKGRGVTRVIECGPGSVLAGLVRRIDRGIETLSTGGLGALEKTIEALQA